MQLIKPSEVKKYVKSLNPNKRVSDNFIKGLDMKVKCIIEYQVRLNSLKTLYWETK